VFQGVGWKRDTRALEQSTPVDKLQSSAEWRRIEEEFLATGRADLVLNALTDATDAITRQAWEANVRPVRPEAAALLAVSAYGRRETFPYSGADLVVLMDPDSQHPAVKAALAAFAQALWGAGLRLTYTVRTLAQCLDGREPLQLPDRRFLAGDAALHSRLENRLPAVVAKQARELRQHLAREARARHARFQDTPRHLTPDVKEAPGGLRDVSLIGRLARLNPEQDAAPAALRDSAAFLAAMRCFMHYRAGRDSNVLDHEAQESLSTQQFLACRDDCMRHYFRQARLVFAETRRALDAAERTQHSILEQFRDYRGKLSNAEFTVTRDRLFLRIPSELDTDPELVMRTAEFIARHGVLPAHETERRLETARPSFARWSTGPRAIWPALKTILSAPHGFTALRALENTGLLSALFPEWAAIEDLPIADEEHRYTADEHTLRTLEIAVQLQAPTDPSLQRFSQLLSELDHRALLMAALLFHEMCGEPAREALERIGMPQSDRETVLFLIEHRRDLADAITGRDMDDPATAHLLATRIGTVERLKMLAVMTYARMGAALADAMTPWRIEQLWKAYSVTQRELTRELETERIQQVPGELSTRAEFIKGFPLRYLRARPAAEIETHVRLFDQSRPTGVAVEVERIEGAYRLTIVARDRPYLFASFTGAITSFGLDILKAEAFANARGVVLDTFVFADPKRLLQLNPSEMERLQDLVQRVALGKTDARRFMRNAQPSSKKRAAPPEVRFDSETCDTATLVEIVTEDRPGLLYSLATVFSSHACNIDVVLVDTKGHRAIDVFYVAFEGRKLPAELQTILHEQLLAAC
jgi:[protein-PII] uridylyltransferase